MAGGGVINDIEGAGGGAGGVDGLATGVDGWGDDDGASCTFVAAKAARSCLRQRRHLAPERAAALSNEGSVSYTGSSIVSRFHSIH